MAPPAVMELFFQKLNIRPFFRNKSQNLWSGNKRFKGLLVEGQRSCLGKTSGSGEEKKQLRSHLKASSHLKE